MKKIVLASASPRRKELLQGLGIDFTVDTLNNFVEVVPEGTSPRDVPVLMAEGKSKGFHRELAPDEILITADTVVILPGESDKCLGKPHSREDAIEMLRSLGGRWHEVITAVCVRTREYRNTVADCTKVHFNELSGRQIEYYVDNFKPFDKAGAYGIQEWIGYAAIDSIEGSFYNVMGLPVHLVYSELKKLEVF